MPEMTEQRLAEIEARAEKASPASGWTKCHWPPSDYYIGRINNEEPWSSKPLSLTEADVDMCVNARTDIPDLCAALRTAWDKLEVESNMPDQLLDVHAICEQRDTAWKERDAAVELLRRCNGRVGGGVSSDLIEFLWRHDGRPDSSTYDPMAYSKLSILDAAKAAPDASEGESAQ